MSLYKTISSPATARFTEKKSEFIASIAPVKTADGAAAYIAEVRRSHKKARHNCYAYILRENNISKHSDDGEPAGTAGAPIYGVLSREGLFDVVCVVTRYFGGILLGAGGLTRAYGKAAAMGVQAARTVKMEQGWKLIIKADYGKYGKIAALIAETDGYIENGGFTDIAEIHAVVPQSQAEYLEKKIVEVCGGKVFVQFAQKNYYVFGEKDDFRQK